MAAHRIVRQKPRRVFGGTVRQDEVYVGEKFIGHIQTKRVKGRTHVITCLVRAGRQTCVSGAHPEWLVREHGLGRGRRK